MNSLLSYGKVDSMSTSTTRTRRRSVPMERKLLHLGYELSHLRDWDSRPGHEGEIVVTDDYERTGPYGRTGPLRKYNPCDLEFYDPPYKSIWASQDEKHSGPPYKTGGPFRSLKMELRYKNKTYGFGRVESVPKDSTLVGGISPPPEVLWEHGDLFQNPVAVTLNGGLFFPSLVEYHDRAWNKLKPKIESTGGLVFLYELRDLPGQLRTSARFFNGKWNDWLSNPHTGNLRHIRTMGRLMPKEVSDHWLNYQFGWAPFIKDLMNIKDTIEGYNSKAQALTSDNGKWVKGRVTVKDDSGSVLVKRINSGNYLPGYPVTIPYKYLNGDITYEIWDDFRTRIYATGEFAYYRPEFDAGRADFDSAYMAIHRLLSIYGVRVTPAHLWAITPWSWLVDWFTGFGNYLNYLQDIWLDSLVGRNCYIMRNYHVIRSFRIAVPFKSGVKNFIFTREIVCKQRDPFSSPYGPSLSWSDLSARQLSILGALGITRR